MSLSLGSKPETHTAERPDAVGDYGVRQMMHHGLGSLKSTKHPIPSHKLESSETHWFENRDKLDFITARNMQGMHMPLKLGMERFATSQVGRLPCMATRTSNLMYDTLTGRDEMIDPADVFNSPNEYPEKMGNPHALMERRLGIL